MLLISFPTLKTSLLPHQTYLSDIKYDINLSANLGANCEVLCT